MARLRAEAESKLRAEIEAKVRAEIASVEREKQAKKDGEIARLKAEAEDAKKAVAAAENDKAKLEAKAAFVDSIAGLLFLAAFYCAYSCNCLTGAYAKQKLKFEVLRVELVKPTAAHARYETVKSKLRALRESNKGDDSKMLDDDIKERFVFHSCPADVLHLICANTLRPSLCEVCKAGKKCHDPGYFGDHTKGVYVSKHAGVPRYHADLTACCSADYTFFYVNYQEVTAGEEGATIMLKCVTGRRKHFREMVSGIAPTPGFHCHESPNHLEFFIFNPDQVVPVCVVHWKAVLNTRSDILHES